MNATENRKRVGFGTTIEDVERLQVALGHEKDKRKAARQDLALLRESVLLAIADLSALLPEGMAKERERELEAEIADLRGEIAGLKARAA